VVHKQGSRLARRLTLPDAVTVGLGAMIGAGVFSAFTPAAQAAGAALLFGLGLAGVIAFCNATSSAQLAALYPESGGTYVYGQRRLGPVWGFLAGWSFIVGKTASCAAMAITLGAYAFPEHPRPIAIAAVIVAAVVNYLGISKTVGVTRVVVLVVMVVLGLVVIASLSGDVDTANITSDLGDHSLHDILQSAGFLFFAFAGYARIATLGEEVIDPERTIPRAIPIALFIALAVYLLVGSSILLAVGPQEVAHAKAPLAAAVQAGEFAGLTSIVRGGAAVASFGVLLSLLAGVGRTAFAMAANGDLFRGLAAVHPRFKVPHRAEIAAAVVVCALVAWLDLRATIGFSSVLVLIYYGIANTSAWTLSREERRWPRLFAAAGVVGCVAIALSLPTTSVLAGAAVLLTVGAIYLYVRRTAKAD
jgi:basic amino acid/polyamine antiporter, APA family